MDFDAGSAGNQQVEPRNTEANFPTLMFYHSCPCHLGVPVSPYFVPILDRTMCPTTAFEHPMLGELRPSVSHENRGGASPLKASSKIQGQQSIANSDFEFESAPPVETPHYAAIEHQNRHYETGINATMPNILGFSQASTVAHTPGWTPLPYPAAEQRGWHSEPAAHANMQSELDFPFQGSADHNRSPNGYGQDTTNNMLDAGNASEATDSPGSLSGAATTREMKSNNFYQPLNTTFGVSAPSQELSPHPGFNLNLNPETSSTASSPLNFTPSPTNLSSPNSTSTRHSCSHCTKTFARQTDVRRHGKSHFPEQNRMFPCSVQDCPRNGERAFIRSDKWMQHRRTVHGLRRVGSEAEG
ncbi:hypothetical protein BKA61DRAFT_139602 [Leptodontidium sp. MPI-SDFR-AT-0119]|nr:hypothetical protein BKA61DRAFT_139602 [Leptodontidium sp. MPI-SDFR-AT-0119]